MKKAISLIVTVMFVTTCLGAIALAADLPTWSRSALWNPDYAKLIDTSKYKKDPPYRLAYANVSVSNSYGVLTQLEFKARCDTYGDMIKEYFVTDAQDRPEKQISDIEDLVTKGIDLIIVRAATEAALDPVITRLHKQGYPIICFARRVKSDNFVSFVTQSLKAEGRMQAIWLCEMLKGKGNIVILPGKVGSGSTEERKRAYYDTLQYYPGIKVLDEQYTQYSSAVAKKVMATMIQKFGDKIDGVLTDTGLQGRGAIEALHEAGLKIPITADMVNGYMKRVKNWGYPALATSYSPALGGDSVDAAMKILQGIPVPFEYEMPRVVATTVDTMTVKGEVPWDAHTFMDKGDDLYTDLSECMMNSKYMNELK